jgi:hypothetical protein
MVSYNLWQGESAAGNVQWLVYRFGQGQYPGTSLKQNAFFNLVRPSHPRHRDPRIFSQELVSPAAGKAGECSL